MKAVKLAHRFGCVGYTLLAAVISLTLFPLSYVIYTTGNDATIALLSYVVMGLSGAVIAAVILRYNLEFWLAAAIWLPEVFVSLMAYMLSFTYFEYRLANNALFDQRIAISLNLVAYQAVILAWYGWKNYQQGTGIFQPKIGGKGKRNNIPRLVKLLAHRNEDVRRDAAKALANQPDPRAVEPLIAALNAELAGGYYTSTLGCIIDALVKSNDPRTFLPLRDYLYTGNVLMIPSAMDGMITLDRDRATLALIEALQNGTPYVRAEAAERLGQLKDVRAVDALVAALAYQPETTKMNQFDQDALKRLRILAVNALGKISTPAAVDALIAALQGEDLTVAAQAAQQLGYLKDNNTVQYLEKTLGYADLQTFGGGELEQRANLQLQSAVALARIGTPEAQQAIAAHIHETYHWHRVATALIPFAEILLPQVRAWIALVQQDSALVETIGKPAIPALLYALQYADQEHQLFAARILGRQGYPEAFATFRKILDDEGEMKERLQIVELLEEIGGSQALSVLQVAADDAGAMRDEYYLSYEQVQRAASAAIQRLQNATPRA